MNIMLFLTLYQFWVVHCTANMFTWRLFRWRMESSESGCLLWDGTKINVRGDFDKYTADTKNQVVLMLSSATLTPCCSPLWQSHSLWCSNFCDGDNFLFQWQNNHRVACFVKSYSLRRLTGRERTDWMWCL